jgi:hypothetical protein
VSRWNILAPLSWRNLDLHHLRCWNKCTDEGVGESNPATFTGARTGRKFTPNPGLGFCRTALLHTAWKHGPHCGDTSSHFTFHISHGQQETMVHCYLFWPWGAVVWPASPLGASNLLPVWQDPRSGPDELPLQGRHSVRGSPCCRVGVSASS